jgi:hypothetical protein
MATVSVAALATAAGISSAQADNVLFDLTAAPPTIASAAASASVVTSNQLDISTNITANNATSVIGSPTAGTHDMEGGTDSIFVDFDTIFAEATGNTATNVVDLYSATGAPTLNAATTASLQANIGNSVATLDATVTSAEIRADYEDLGAGSSVVVDNDTIRADATELPAPRSS